ncbi:MAG: cobalamin biosynthesis protein CbiX [bacterium]
MTRTALVISHGQPSDPDPAETELADLTARVALLLPGWQIESATLAAPRSLSRAISRLGPQGRAYPLFMAGGWFSRVHLPARLAEAGGPGWQVLEPLGCDPAIHDLAIRIIADMRPASVVLAAHGSFRSPVPAAIANHVADRIAREAGVARVDAAFIDQTPRLASITGHGPDAACLPFFAASGDHVTDDIPAALTQAGFQGRLLPALGLHGDVPGIIARAIQAGVPTCAQRCHWQQAD